MKKIIKVFVFCFMFLAFSKNIFALGVDIEYIDGVYSNRIGDDKIYSGQLGFVKINGEYVFCLEPYKIVGNNYNIDNSYFDNIDKEDLEYIKLVSNYTKFYMEHKNFHMYMAAQELIWERLYGKDKFFWTTEKNGGGERINISIFKEEIENHIKHFYLKPSFDGTYVRDSFYSTVTLTDSNNVLSFYELDEKNKRNAWINGDQLVIRIDQSAVEEIKLIRKDSFGEPIYYQSDTNQDFANLSSYVENISTLKVEANDEYYVNVLLNFLDSNSKKRIDGGIKFKVLKEDGTFLGEYTTYTGTYYLEEKFNEGKYKVELIDVPKNYVVGDSLEFEIKEETYINSNTKQINYEISKAVGMITVNNLKGEKVDVKIYAYKNIYNDFNNLIFKKNQLIHEISLGESETYKTDILPFGYYCVKDNDREYFVLLEYIDQYTGFVNEIVDIVDNIQNNIDNENENHIVEENKKVDDNSEKIEDNLKEKTDDDFENKEEVVEEKLNEKINDNFENKEEITESKKDNDFENKEEVIEEKLDEEIEDILPNTFDYILYIKVFLVIGLLIFKNEK